MLVEDWDHVQRLFESAADLPAAEQKRFLDEVCSDNPDVRAELESLLRSDRQSGARISSAIGSEASRLFESLVAGDRVGSYRILHQIGHGGMGAVYLAERDDHQYVKRVAIKVVRRGMDTEELLARFRYERQILASLDHPYIARLYDGGTTPDGRPFFVMEYIEGKPVNLFCRERNLGVRARCRLFLKLCEAVSYAHRNLVIHRDLKPGNILVKADDTPKLLDFGLAKLLSERPESRNTVVIGNRPFTPDYASPEQVRGLPMTTATDIYSLGAVFYEMLTGRRPHQFGSYSADEVTRAVCETQIVRPSSVAHQVDADLDNIVLMAMRREPERRYQSVDQFVEDVRRYLAGEAVTARGDAFGYRARKFVARYHWQLAAATMVFASLITATVVSQTESHRAEAARRTAEAQRTEAVRERALAEAASRRADAARQAETAERLIADQQRDEAQRQRARAEERVSDLVDLANRTLFDVHTAIATLPGSVEARRTIVKTTLDYLEKLAKQGGQDDRVRLVLSDAWLKVAMIQGDPFGPSLEDFKGARESTEKAEALLRPLYLAKSGDPDLIERWLETEIAVAVLKSEATQRRQAVEMLSGLLPIAHRLAELRPADYQACKQEAMVHWQLADILQYEDVSRALEHSYQQITLLRDLTARFPREADAKLELGVALGMAAGAELLNGELEHSAELYRQSIQAREELLQSDPNNVNIQRGLLVAYGNYAGVLGGPWSANLGRSEEARAACTHAVALARRLANADSQNATARVDLGASLARLGSIDPSPDGVEESLATLREAISILEPLVKANPRLWHMVSHLAIAREYSGRRLESLGRTDQGAEEYKRALALTEEMASAGNPSMIAHALFAENSLALLYASREDRASALDYAARSIALAEKQYAAVTAPSDVHRGRVAKSWFVNASVRAKFNDTNGAREALAKSGAMWSQIHNRGILALYRKDIEDTAGLETELNRRAQH